MSGDNVFGIRPRERRDDLTIIAARRTPARLHRFDHGDVHAGFTQVQGGRKAGEPAADHDNVGVRLACKFRRSARAVSPWSTANPASEFLRHPSSRLSRPIRVRYFGPPAQAYSMPGECVAGGDPIGLPYTIKADRRSTEVALKNIVGIDHAVVVVRDLDKAAENGGGSVLRFRHAAPIAPRWERVTPPSCSGLTTSNCSAFSPKPSTMRRRGPIWRAMAKELSALHSPRSTRPRAPRKFARAVTQPLGRPISNGR